MIKVKKVQKNAKRSSSHIKNPDNNILIAKRQQGKSMTGFWEFPGDYNTISA
ncbi:MAG: hypothetical protein ABF633_15115 [Clostridium sp.]|uniref:hypothetical protein n=1 Tax=Clostridium sp. TaxID=1506 RepID=UPI0039EAFE2F